MPRRGDLRETRNDHQLATARRFRELGKIETALDEEELHQRLEAISRLREGGPIGPFASPQLIQAVRRFITEAGVITALACLAATPPGGGVSP